METVPQASMGHNEAASRTIIKQQQFVTTWLILLLQRYRFFISFFAKGKANYRIPDSRFRAFDLVREKIAVRPTMAVRYLPLLES